MPPLRTLLALLCVAPAAAAQAPEFGYASPEAALAALRQRADVRVFEQNGWTVADDKANRTWWSFTPPGHPAHPSGVKRVLMQSTGGEVSIAMTAKCGASDEACEALLVEFHLMNDRLRERLKSAR